jgi:hypothetical protein
MRTPVLREIGKKLAWPTRSACFAVWKSLGISIGRFWRFYEDTPSFIDISFFFCLQVASVMLYRSLPSRRQSRSLFPLEL